jgi:energy-coupling factor transporter ATP-binding protein EcfA2
LSGGQAKRAALAGLLVHEFEVLILDEPTNHLDLDAIRFLEEWLAEYRGGLVLVTHDRHVLDRVTTKVLELDRGHGYLHVPTGWHARVRLCRVPCGPRRTRGTRRGRRTGSQEPGHPRAGLAAPWRAGAHVEAEGAHRHGDGAGGGPSPGGRESP